MTTVIGWDLGGANLKLARVDDGRVTHAAQIPARSGKMPANSMRRSRTHCASVRKMPRMPSP